MAYAELSDCRCFYEVMGRGEPLIMIPGLAATSHSWEPAIPELSQHFSLLLFDSRGIGRSVARRKPAHISELVSDIIELLDFLQLDRAHVLGVSLGGVIAQRLAIDHPSRVDRLVLVSCADMFSPYLRQMSLFLAHMLRRFPREKFVRMMELLATAPEFLDANGDLVEQRVKRKCDAPVSARAVGNQLRCLASAEIDPPHYRIIAPTLVVAGEYDPIVPGCYAKRMAGKIPGSMFHLVPGAGHNPVVDHPDVVVPKIVEFLRARKEDETQRRNLNGYVACGTGGPPVFLE